MEACLRVLSENEKAEIHERSLQILSKTGVKVETAKGRACLESFGASVSKNSDIVHFPRELIERSLQSVPKKVVLGARRPGMDFPLNTGACTLLMSGEGTHTLDRFTGEYRASTFSDWLEATLLADALDEIGIYWCIVTATDKQEEVSGYVTYIHNLIANFSKHIQDMINSPEKAPWLLEALQIVFGSKKEIQEKKPFSYVLCPQSPLIIDQQYTDAYLELVGWGMPVAVVPMPLMGATAPASLASTLLLANCEILATLCLVQAAEPGVPLIYAPVSTLMDPRTGSVMSGAVERGLLSAASIEMARYYGLPAQTSGLGASGFSPGIQSSYESALTALTPMLAQPDILVGPGLLGSAMILSIEQMLIDVEIFSMCRQAGKGILTGDDKWMDQVICEKGPGSHFIDHPSTLTALREGAWHTRGLGVFEPFEVWDANGRPKLIERSRERVDHILKTHEPLPLSADMEREFMRMHKKTASR